MRRQVKPFTVERRRGGRSVAAADNATVLEMPRPEPETAPEKPHAPRWAAAEALFSIPKAETKPASDETSSERSGSAGRILPNLLEPPTPAPSHVLEDAPKRRGRKPGSRNKIQRAPRHAQGPKTIDNVMRNVFAFWAREDVSDGDEPLAASPAPDLFAEPVTEISPVATIDGPIETGAPLALRRRGRLSRQELPRGQRWKARLSRFAR